MIEGLQQGHVSPVLAGIVVLVVIALVSAGIYAVMAVRDRRELRELLRAEVARLVAAGAQSVQ